MNNNNVNKKIYETFISRNNSIKKEQDIQS